MEIEITPNLRFHLQIVPLDRWRRLARDGSGKEGRAEAGREDGVYWPARMDMDIILYWRAGESPESDSRFRVYVNARGEEEKEKKERMCALAAAYE